MKFPIPDFLPKKIDELISSDDTEFVDDLGDEVSQKELEQLPVFLALQNALKEGMALDELIDAFAAMCKLPVGDPDDLLFETGTFDFTGKKLFYFSLVRQFRFRDEDEFVQLHLDVRYAPSPATKRLSCTEWSSLTERDFFDLVRSSAAYHAVKEMPVAQVEIYIEET